MRRPNRTSRALVALGVLAGMLVSTLPSVPMPALALNTPPATDPAATSTPAGVTSVPETDGKARGSGLWGYAGDVKTRASGKVFSYGLSVSPADGALWVTDSAKPSGRATLLVAGRSKARSLADFATSESLVCCATAR